MPGQNAAVVHNGCNYTVRVQAQTTFARDSSCTTLQPGRGFQHKYHSGGNFVGVVNC